MLSLFKKYLWNNILPITFPLLFIVVDFLIKVNGVFNDYYLYRFGAIVKVLFLAILIGSVIFKGGNKKHLTVLLLLFSSFALGQLVLKGPSYFYNNFVNEIISGDFYYFIRYIYIYIFIIFLHQSEERNYIIGALEKGFIFIIIINSVCVILGWLFKLEIFQSYSNGLRFGYSGIFSRVSDANYIYIIAVIKYSYHYIETRQKSHMFKAISLMVIALLFGTKLMWIFPVIWLYFLLFQLYGFSFKKNLIYVFLALGSFFYKDILLGKFINYFPFWKKLHLENGWLTIISSKRDILMQNFFNFVQEKWGLVNFLFGGSDYKNLNVQIEFVDVYYVLGIPGIVFFCYLFFTHFCEKQIKLLPYILMILISSVFSGNLLLSVNCMIFLFIVFYNINLRCLN